MNTRFGEFGGQYIPEILMSEINHVAEAYDMKSIKMILHLRRN